MLPTLAFCETVKTDLSNDRFGKINIYRGDSEPLGTVVLFSGENGFDPEADDLAKEISKNNLLVIGVNSARYIAGYSKEDKDEDCSYLAGEITRLSQAVQSTEKLKSYKKPLLMGVRSGAALAYAIAVQYPYEFTGLVTIGFCPELSATAVLCEGEGLKATAQKNIQTFNERSNLQIAWREFSSPEINSCAVGQISQFFSKQKDQILTSLPKGEKKIEVSDPWFVQLQNALQQLSQDQDPENELEDAVSDLPLIELSPQKRLHDSLIVIISGDGGWATIDKELGEYFKTDGYEVLGFNALRYFWQKKTPDQVAADINRAIRFYRTKLGVDDIRLVGFSLGADILPFVINRLTQDNKKDIKLVTLLSPGKSTDFEIHVADWLGIENGEDAYDVSAEIKKMLPNKVLCIYGTDDEDQSCTSLDRKQFKLRELPGDHHFDGDYERVAKIILEPSF